MKNEDIVISDSISDREMRIQYLHQLKWKTKELMDHWSDTLETFTIRCLLDNTPSATFWGPDHLPVFNDAYKQTVAANYPPTAAAIAKDSNPRWQELVPLLNRVLTEGTSFTIKTHTGFNSPGEPSQHTDAVFAFTPIINNRLHVEGVYLLVTHDAVSGSDKSYPGTNLQPRSQDIIAQAPVGLLLLDKSSFLIKTANPHIHNITGLLPEQVVDKDFFEIFPAEKRKELAKLLHDHTHGADISISEELSVPGMRGGEPQEKMLKIVYKLFFQENQGSSGVIVLVEDITEQVNANKQNEIVELRLKIALEAAAIGTFEWDIKNSVFVYSERLAEIFGYKDTAGLGHQSFTSLIHPDDVTIRTGAHTIAGETGVLFYEARFIWLDKSVHWVRLNGKMVYGANKEPLKMYGTATNLDNEKLYTEKLERLIQQRTSTLRRSYEELQKSEERYHKMVDEVQDYAIILLDENGIVQNWNKGAEYIKQYKESEIVGKSFKLFYQAADRENKLPERLLELARTTGRAVHEGWRVRKDQTIFWGSVALTALHDDKNNVIGFSKVTRDLTDRKKAEDRLNNVAEELQKMNESLRKSEERYHKMINEVQDYAIILLNENGDIENWNYGAQKIKGYSAAEIIGQNFKIFYTKDDRQSGLPQRLMQEAVVHGKAIHEGWRVRKDGSKFWGSIVLTALHGAGGSIIGFSKVTRDLTERKLAEDRMKKYLQELQSQNKELEQFAYVASHDLQEPLRKIQTFASLLGERLEESPSARSYLQKIILSAERMSDLIKAVLNYSRIADKDDVMVTTDLNDVLKSVEVDFEILIKEKNATIISDVLPAINAMPLQIHQLFSNLMSNSLKFTKNDPVIQLHWQVVSRDEIRNNPGNLTQSTYFEISFSDNGIGFDKNYEKKMFVMFQRLHGRKEYVGTGIGLALCKKIVESHDGFITGHSEEGKGSTFFMYFPCEQLYSKVD